MEDRGSPVRSRSTRVRANGMKEPVVVAMTFVGPDRSLYKFQPVNVAKGTRSSGMRMPGMSLSSGSACGNKAGKEELSFGGNDIPGIRMPDLLRSEADTPELPSHSDRVSR